MVRRLGYVFVLEVWSWYGLNMVLMSAAFASLKIWRADGCRRQVVVVTGDNKKGTHREKLAVGGFLKNRCGEKN